ncbi:conserved hypothetical protein [Histoplasma capsulatum H143]|uniref:Uncharacterized protein n=1 Tax=Ajellomyces capsulatus (strain H143) TaxID=544712 RepID=C6HJF0_AJECH|nr:conserved hypothetical protein [Histoplasma capsulatum H143]
MMLLCQRAELVMGHADKRPLLYFEVTQQITLILVAGSRVRKEYADDAPLELGRSRPNGSPSASPRQIILYMKGHNSDHHPTSRRGSGTPKTKTYQQKKTNSCRWAGEPCIRILSTSLNARAGTIRKRQSHAICKISCGQGRILDPSMLKSDLSHPLKLKLAYLGSTNHELPETKDEKIGHSESICDKEHHLEILATMNTFGELDKEALQRGYPSRRTDE